MNAITKVSWLWWSTAAVFTTFCLLAYYLDNPFALLNHLSILSIDAIFGLVPSTPNEFKIVSLLTQLSTAFPLVGWGVVFQIIQGCAGILTLYLGFKIIKYIPFF